VTLDGISAANKTYDGTTATSITAGSISGTVGSETLLISGAGSFDSNDAGTGKTVTVEDVTALTKANGTGSWSNYNLVTTGRLTTTADIEPRAISISIDSTSKKLRDPDPQFTFATSPGLDPSDRSEFVLTREPGDRPGTYRISAANPNFSITLIGDALLEIEAPPTRSSAEIANDVASNDVSKSVGSLAIGSVAVNPAARVSSAGVKVELVQRPELQSTGLVTVSVPSDMATSGAGLAFALPNELLAAISNAVNVEATLAGGAPLPSWLRFDGTNGQFVMGDVADVSFPIELSVQLGSQVVTVVISERSQ
jgi:hypothetical protein